MKEVLQICDTCHQYRAMREVDIFKLRNEWYGECAECKVKRLEKAERAKYTPEELLVIAAQSGIEVQRA